jgi:hypothetical protein
VLVINYESKPSPWDTSRKQPIRLTLGFAASEADRELVERLTVAMGARSLARWSAALLETRRRNGVLRND